jgi:hypothetical protein
MLKALKIPGLLFGINGVFDGGAGMLKLFNGWPRCFASSTGMPPANAILGLLKVSLN